MKCNADHLHTYIHILYIHNTYTHIQLYTPAHTHAQTHTCTHARTHRHTHAYTHTRTRTHTHTHAHAHTRTHSHAPVRTYTFGPSQHYRHKIRAHTLHPRTHLTSFMRRAPPPTEMRITAVGMSTQQEAKCTGGREEEGVRPALHPQVNFLHSWVHVVSYLSYLV